MRNRSCGSSAPRARGILFAAFGLLLSGTALAAPANPSGALLPVNDECATAGVLVDGLNLGLTNVGATTSLEAAPTCSGVITTDVWFTYTATCAGSVTFSMCGTLPTWDSVLAVYTGACGAQTQFACDDDSCPGAPAGGDVSIATTPVVAAGTVLTVRVGGFTGSPVTAAAFEVLVTCTPPPPNDDCAGASPLADGFNGPFSNATATSGPTIAPCSTSAGFRDLWYSYVATCTGPVTISTCDTTGGVTLADPIVQVFTSCGGNALACNDDFCSLRSAVTYDAVAGSTYLIRISAFSSTATGTYNVVVTCAGVSTTDFGDAAFGNLAAHTSATVSERLGTAVSGELSTRHPAWFGDDGDDGIVSVTDLFPGSATATIVVSAVNPSPFGPFTDNCRLWVRRTSLATGWLTATEGLATQTASVGSTPVLFTFGPFTHSATGAPSPYVRVRLSFNTTGVSSSVGTGSYGEVEDYVLPGTGGPVTTSSGGGGVDAGDAPLPYPPVNARNLSGERLGATNTADTMAPVGFPATSWINDGGDDGVLSITGLNPGGNLVVRVHAEHPTSGTFLDIASVFADFDGDGNWDEPGEHCATSPFTTGIAPGGTDIDIGPLPVPASVVKNVPMRVKLSSRSASRPGELASGASYDFGEIEDYLVPSMACGGCNSGGGPVPTLFSRDAARSGVDFNMSIRNAEPLTPLVWVFGRFAGQPGGDFASMGVPIPPGICFLCVFPQLLFGLGATDAAGSFDTPAGTFPVPASPAFVGAPANIQAFQVLPTGGGGATFVATNALVTVVVP